MRISVRVVRFTLSLTRVFQERPLGPERSISRPPILHSDALHVVRTLPAPESIKQKRNFCPDEMSSFPSSPWVTPCATEPV